MVYRFLLICGLFWRLALNPDLAVAQHEAFIYGKIETTGGQQYSGQIRWSAQQVYWSDFIFALKTDVPVLQYLTETQINNLSADAKSSGFDWQFMNLWKTKYPERQHDLKIRFGDLAAIQPDGALQATLTLKNGNRFKATTHPDDNRHLGKDITVFDARKGQVKIDWDKLVRVQFLPTPARLAHLNATPLYGTVITSNGPVTGLIIWDRDEYLTSHVLDGQLENSTQTSRYAFGNILSIQARDKGALVKLKSGEKVFLKNNRDVNTANRGILVQHPERGLALIKWSAFRSVTFTDKIPGGLGYNAYPKPHNLKATIQTTENRNYTSTFVFDLDEEWDLEILDGQHESGIQYWLPFRYIKSIKPLSENAAEVTLTDEKKLILGGQYDVTGKNWGLMLNLPQARHRYLPWNTISLISFL
jgi:hypothetical protein